MEIHATHIILVVSMVILRIRKMWHSRLVVYLPRCLYITRASPGPAKAHLSLSRTPDLNDPPPVKSANPREKQFGYVFPWENTWGLTKTFENIFLYERYVFVTILHCGKHTKLRNVMFFMDSRIWRGGVVQIRCPPFRDVCLGSRSRRTSTSCKPKA